MTFKSFNIIFGLMVYCTNYQITHGLPSQPTNLPEILEENTQIDHDVLELEHLQHKIDDTLDEKFSIESPTIEKSTENIFAEENQKEKIKTETIQGQPEREEEILVQHRPPHATGTAVLFKNKANEAKPDDTTEKLPSTPKLFHGAARLTFGQNTDLTQNEKLNSDNENKNIFAVNKTDVTPTELIINTTLIPENVEQLHNETDDLELEHELEATKSRRSVDVNQRKTSDAILKHAGSSFDLAQYIFWTGDQEGVAKSIEDLIEQGLMSRENALIFLKEIRTGMEYLEKSYDNRVSFGQNGNRLKKNDLSFQKLNFQNSDQNQHKENKQHAFKDTFKTLPTLLRLQAANLAVGSADSENYDDTNGRARVADFLYSEYSLEEVIYQLAKVMFSQSLSHGSAQAENSLQRLTAFLEKESEQGSISPALQKKILEVLLAALSDTLTDHPELLASARSNLGNSFNLSNKPINTFIQ